MKILLDTHLLLWAASGAKQLSNAARTLIEEPTTEIMFSAASLWEIVIKQTLGRDDFQIDSRILRRELLDNGYIELPITSEHTLEIVDMPLIHKDPFDRILIAQSRVEGILLLTSDPIVAKYSGSIRFV
jgi:PIN domain nuclease of toxin-antitoxin system